MAIRGFKRRLRAYSNKVSRDLRDFVVARLNAGREGKVRIVSREALQSEIAAIRAKRQADENRSQWRRWFQDKKKASTTASSYEAARVREYRSEIYGTAPLGSTVITGQ